MCDYKDCPIGDRSDSLTKSLNEMPQPSKLFDEML